MGQLHEVNVVDSFNAGDYVYINNGSKTNQVSKTDFEGSLTVTSQVVISGIVNDTSTTYTPDSNDVNKWIRLDNASSITATINASASQGWSLGNVLYFYQLGAGAVTIAAGAGVTLNGVLTTTTQYQGVACINVGSDTWDVVGVV